VWFAAGIPYVMCHPDVPDEATALQLANSFLRQEYGEDLTQHFGQRSAIPRLPFRATLDHDTWIVTNAVYARLAWAYTDGGIEIYMGRHAGCIVRAHVVP